MKYIEELSSGDSFLYEDKPYFLTSDFKSNGQRLSYSLKDGFAKWFKNTDIVDLMPVYRLDNDNNIIALKETKKDEHHTIKNTNIS
jgi:hypothetical protein